jgi:hypothetical protein
LLEEARSIWPGWHSGLVQTDEAAVALLCSAMNQAQYVKTALLLIFLRCAIPFSANCPRGQAREEKALIQLEEKWAKALDQHDSQVISCLLADEFQDTDINGAVHDRAEALGRVARPRQGSNRLEEMHAHIYGHAGFVRGINRVMDPSGKVLATVRFTDIFVYRDTRWQAVAGQETLVTGNK